MSIVSGLATATGVSSLLNAPRDTNLTLRQQTGEAAPLAAVRRAEAKDAQVEGRAVTVRPVQSAGVAEQAATPSKQSSDPRYSQFVDAVTALRIDFSEATLTRQRIAELRAAAKEVFKMDDGIPREVKPDIPTPEARAAEARQERAEAAARRQEAAEKTAEADRLEAAVKREEAQAKADARAVDDRRPAVPAEEARARPVPGSEAPAPDVPAAAPVAGAPDTAVPVAEPAPVKVSATDTSVDTGPAAPAPERAAPAAETPAPEVAA